MVLQTIPVVVIVVVLQFLSFPSPDMMFSRQVSNQDIHTENPPMVSGSGIGPIAKSHMGRYSSSSFFFPHEHQLELSA
jgi:hypothetical protein